MELRFADKKDGTRIKKKDFPYLEEGKAVGAAYDKILFDCQREPIDAETTDTLMNKLDTWHKTSYTANKVGTIVLLIATICVIPFILIPVFYFAFQVYLPAENHRLLIPLLLIALVSAASIWFMIKGLKRHKSENEKAEQLYHEAKALAACDTPELYSCQIAEKQWYEAVDETDRYFLTSEHLTFRVDCSKYEQTKKGDSLTLALIGTKDDHLLFIL